MILPLSAIGTTSSFRNGPEKSTSQFNPVLINYNGIRYFGFTRPEAKQIFQQLRYIPHYRAIIDNQDTIIINMRSEIDSHKSIEKLIIQEKDSISLYLVEENRINKVLITQVERHKKNSETKSLLLMISILVGVIVGVGK
jgi:hypothetical protein